MTESTLIEGGLLEKEGAGESSHWVRRVVLVTFCLLLFGTLGVVFTRVVAERVPEQRATLERLITERTGLAVRFDNVHFAWGLDGTSAVFTRVELTDPSAGRVRVVAPELRVEFDTWDFLRHQQFSLGHVTLSSPDIEITGEPEQTVIQAALATPKPRGKQISPAEARDETALVRRYLAWAELMPNGRIEVEAARVHLRRRGESAAHSSFTLSQAVVSRGPSTFNAYGTMLLAQDVGQSLFVSAKLENLGAGSRASGDLRMIARRVFLDRLSVPGLSGRGTLDAKLHLLDGRIDNGRWQASARELELNDGTRFDHLTVNGRLSRDAADLLLDFTDLQLTRGARLERAPNLSVRLAFDAGSTHIARTTVRADRVPFMAAEFIAGLLTPELDVSLVKMNGGWSATAGELRGLRFDSGARQLSHDAWTFTAQVSGVELSRSTDRAQVSQLAARVRLDAQRLEFIFDPANAASVHLSHLQEPRPLAIDGHLAFLTNADSPGLDFAGFNVRSGEASAGIDGSWVEAAARSPQVAPLVVTAAHLDRALLNDAWLLIARDSPQPEVLASIAEGSVVEGRVNLVKATGVTGIEAVNWQRSSGKLTLAGLATSGQDLPHLKAGAGAIDFARGAAQLKLASGEIDDLTVTAARLDWPRTGTPRMQASLTGALDSTLLRGVLAEQGLERLTGQVTIDADARGERELREPALWRVTARIDDAAVALAGGLPPVEKISGTLRYGNRQLRALALEGSWLGGAIEIESRRGATRALNLAIHGDADSAPLLQLLGHAEIADRVSGQLSWSGSAQQLVGHDAWQISLSGNLAGIESHLPEPFDKQRARQLAVTAQVRVDATGVREFEIDSGRDLRVRGQVDSGVIAAQFELQGVAGVLRRTSTAGAEPQVDFERLELRRAPLVLAATGALLPKEGDLAMTIGELVYSGRSLGALRANVARRDTAVEFSFDSPQTSLHQLSAQGSCDPERLCRAEFTADTAHLTALLRGVQLPAEWPTESLHAAGVLTWPAASGDPTRSLAGHFDLETQGGDSNHQLVANATLADGQIRLDNVQGSGPAIDQVFRGTGRVSLLARNYDLTVDYEQVALAATAVPTPARAKFTRAWNVLRGSVARRGWTEPPTTRRVEWHGTWEGDRAD